jgi:hypothetical protein
LRARFEFEGVGLAVINNHWASRLGNVAAAEDGQLAPAGGEAKRVAQAVLINEAVAALLDEDPGTNVIVLGDFNTLPSEVPLAVLDGDHGGERPVLFDLLSRRPADEQYDYVFQGQPQALAHMLVSGSLNNNETLVDVVRLNAGFSAAASDHDPLLASLRLGDLALAAAEDEEGPGNGNAELGGALRSAAERLVRSATEGGDRGAMAAEPRRRGKRGDVRGVDLAGSETDPSTGQLRRALQRPGDGVRERHLTGRTLACSGRQN